MNPAEVRGSKTGVYYAVTGGDADQYWTSTENKANGYGFLGSCRSMFANRIAFQFDFTGKYLLSKQIMREKKVTNTGNTEGKVLV
jgi:Polyketide synthase modules and related proteins